MIQFHCPCGKALHARNEHVGQTVRCPQCNRELAIPSESGIQPEAPPRDCVDDEPQRGPGRLAGRAWADRPRPPATSGMAIASMILGLASLFCTVFTAVPALILGLLGLRAVGRSGGRLQGKGLAVTGLVTGGVGLLLTVPLALFVGLPVLQRLQESPNKQAEANALKQFALAMHGYADSYGGTFPAAAVCDAKGKPLLSWRVAILPWIEQANLYRQFHLDEPWDSPNNIKLLPLMPKIYALPGDSAAPPGYTYYRVFVGDHAFFPPPQPSDGSGRGGRSIAQVPDGLSNTILVAEAADAVPWTKPDELPFDPSGPLPPLGGHYHDGFYVAMADGSVRFVRRAVSGEELRQAIQIDDGENLPLDVQW